MDEAELRNNLKKYKFYHSIKLTESITTPGSQVFGRTQLILMKHLHALDLRGGQRVLDVGCRDGLYSLEAERMGAAEVLGIDNDLSVPATEFIIPFLKSKVKMEGKNLYDLAPAVDGTFDVVIFPGVLYHLRYPFWALKVIRDVMKPGGHLLIETAIWDIQRHHALLFCPIGDESPYEATSPTIFNEKGLRDTLTSLGFETNAVEYMHSGRPFSGLRKRIAAHLRTLLAFGSLPPCRPTRCVFVAQFKGFDRDSFVNKYWEGKHDFHTRFGGGD